MPSSRRRTINWKGSDDTVKIFASRSKLDHGTQFTITFGGRAFEVQVEAPELSIASYDFSIWPLLPYAMKQNRAIEIDLPVSDELVFQANVLQRFLHHYLQLPTVALQAA